MDDLISRQAAIDEVAKALKGVFVEYQDVAEKIINKLSNVLPPSDSAPEISDLDDEIFRDIGIVPVRDAQGKFLKGQRAVAKPKKLYSKKYPKLACDTCFNAQKCPQYKAGYSCVLFLYKGDCIDET